MNNIRTEVVGIDKEIQKLQTYLYDSLNTLWGGNIVGYGRAYKNIKDDKNIYEYYLKENDYQLIYHNDVNAATMFFLDDDKHTTDDGILYTAEVRCVLMVDLGKIYPTDVDRSDSKAHKEVSQLIHDNYAGDYKIKSIEKGVDNVFKGVDKESVRFSDISPEHCFSIVMDLSYYLNDC